MRSSPLEPDRRLRQLRCSGIGGHDQDDIAEIDALAVVIGQLAVVHHLQQDVEQVGMRLLDFVEQKHRVRLLVDGVGQQAALIEPDVPGGAPISREMLCRSMYSDMSKRTRSMPRT